MVKFLRDIFSDSSDISSIRVMSFLCVLFSFGVAMYSLVNQADPEKVAWLIAAFLGPAFGGKVWQKKMEKS